MVCGSTHEVLSPTDVTFDPARMWENWYISEIHLDELKIPLQNHDIWRPKDIYTEYHRNHTFL